MWYKLSSRPWEVRANKEAKALPKKSETQQMKNIIRLLTLTINNFKTIGHGEISMPCMLNGFDRDKADIVGIYGQNGSGKTSAIEALLLLQRIWQGKPLDDAETALLIRSGEQDMYLKTTFQYLTGEEDYTITYSVTIRKIKKVDPDGKQYYGIGIPQESLIMKLENKKYAQPIICAIFDTNEGFKNPKSVQTTELFNRLNKAFKGDLDLQLARCYDNRQSYIFSPEVRKEILKFNDRRGELVTSLVGYAFHQLIIVDRKVAGLIACNFAQPLSVYQPDVAAGSMLFNMMQPDVIPEDIYHQVEQLIDSINVVLPKLIKGCEIRVRSLGKETNKNNILCERCELYVQKGEYSCVLAHESEGIKKLISILSLLIAVYNQEDVTVAIDELDAGIYEYLLGQILDVLNQKAKGQLIFTAHNLHPLEVLDMESLVLTTDTATNRFIRFPRSRVKASSNLRNMYLRTISLGGLDEEIYGFIQPSEISRSFRNAMAPYNKID